MKKRRLYMICWILPILVHTCDIFDQLPVIDVYDLPNDKDIQISEWRVAGPFLVDNKDIRPFHSGLDQNNLEDFNLSEETITAKTFGKIKRRNARNKQKLLENFRNKILITEFDYFDLRAILPEDKPANAYLACILNSNVEKEIVFLLGSDHGVKIWLNGALLLRLNVNRKIHRYQNFIRARLNKGENFLLVKANHLTTDWRLLFNICSIEQGKKEYKDYSTFDFIESSIIQQNDSLCIDLRLFKDQNIEEIQICNINGETIWKKSPSFDGTLRHDLGNIEEGLYTCMVLLADDTFKQNFYFGDLNKALDNYEVRTAPYMHRIVCPDLISNGEMVVSDLKIKINLDALLGRLRHLLAPNSIVLSKYEDMRIWKKKVVFVLRDLEDVLTRLENNQEAIKHRPGTHLRGYISDIDSSIQHYMLYIPKEYQAQTKIPLIIMMPYGIVDELPFLKNIFIADILSIDRNIQFAREAGCAVLWPHVRGNTYGAPIAYEDLFEVLKAVKSDYNIDEDRIYLNGVCIGGSRALLLACRYPHLFAAVGLFSPYTYDNQGFLAEKSNRILDFIPNMKYIPIHIVHGTQDEYVPMDHSMKLIKTNREDSVSITLNQLTNVSHFCYPNRTQKEIYQFFIDKVRKKVPNKIHFKIQELKYGDHYWIKCIEKLNNGIAEISAKVVDINHIEILTENVSRFEIYINQLNMDKKNELLVVTNGKIVHEGIPDGNQITIEVYKKGARNTIFKSANCEGPINHAFSHPFILVKGSDEIEGGAYINALLDHVGGFWQYKYHGICRKKTYEEIIQSDIYNNHLILLGNQKTNPLLADIMDKLPVDIKTDSIIFRGKTYRGKVNFLFVYPNPLNLGKYIVFIGSNDMGTFRFSEMDLPTNGWYDYKLWKEKEGEIEVLECGFFDQTWQ